MNRCIIQYLEDASQLQKLDLNLISHLVLGSNIPNQDRIIESDQIVDLNHKIQIFKESKVYIDNTKKIKEALDNDGKRILICSELNPKKIKNFWKEIEFEYLILKTCDFENEESSYAGHISNLYGTSGSNSYNIYNLVKRFTDLGIQSEKLSIGIPFFCRAYLDTKGLGMEFSKTVKGYCSYDNLPLGQEYFDDIAIGAYCYDPSKKILICYDNTISIGKKIDYIKENKLGGICYFSDLKISSEITKEMKKIHNILKHSLPKCNFEEDPKLFENEDIDVNSIENYHIDLELDLDSGNIKGSIVSIDI